MNIHMNGGLQSHQLCRSKESKLGGRGGMRSREVTRRVFWGVEIRGFHADLPMFQGGIQTMHGGQSANLEVMFCALEWAGMILMRRSWRRKHRRLCGVNSATVLCFLFLKETENHSLEQHAWPSGVPGGQPRCFPRPLPNLPSHQCPETLRFLQQQAPSKQRGRAATVQWQKPEHTTNHGINPAHAKCFRQVILSNLVTLLKNPITCLKPFGFGCTFLKPPNLNCFLFKIRVTACNYALVI